MAAAKKDSSAQESELFRDLLSDLDSGKAKTTKLEQGAELGQEEEAAAEEEQAETAAESKKATKRHRRRMNLGPKEASARAPLIKGSMKKVRLMCDYVKGLNYPEAIARLAMAPQRAAADISKLLKMAKAHAEHNLGLNPNRLLVAYFHVGRAAQFRQVEFRARGRANIRLRRRSRVEVVLREIPTYEGEKRLGRAGRLNKEYKDRKLRRGVHAQVPSHFIDMGEGTYQRIQESESA